MAEAIKTTHHNTEIKQARSSARLRIDRHTVVVPGRMYADNRLKSVDRDILGHMAVLCNAEGSDGRHGWLTITFQDVMTLSGRGRSSVTDAVRRLVEYGYLEKRSRTDATGASAANQYKISYDVELPLAADRWATCLSSDGIVFTPENMLFEIGDPASAHASATRQNDHQDTRQNDGSHYSGPSVYQDGSAQGDPLKADGSKITDPLFQDGSQHSDPPLKTPEIGGSARVQNSGPAINDPVQTDGPPPSREIDRSLSFSEEELRNAREILVAFQNARSEAYPAEKEFGHAGETGQLKIIAGWMREDGANVDDIKACLLSRIEDTAKRGLDAPYSVKRYDKDVMTVIEAGSARDERAARLPGLPPVPESWNRYVTALSNSLNLGKSNPLRVTLERLHYIGLRDQEQHHQLVLAVPTDSDLRRLQSAGLLERLHSDAVGIIEGASGVDVCVSAQLCSRRYLETQRSTENQGDVA